MAELRRWKARGCFDTADRRDALDFQRRGRICFAVLVTRPLFPSFQIVLSSGRTQLPSSLPLVDQLRPFRDLLDPFSACPAASHVESACFAAVLDVCRPEGWSWRGMDAFAG